LRSGAATWWSSQLSTAATESDRYLVLTTLLVWATPRVILQLSPEISPQLDRFSQPMWNRLFGRLERANKAEKFKVDKSFSRDLANCGLRLAAALALRLPNEAAIEIADAKFSSYRGNDLRLLRFHLGYLYEDVFKNPAKWSGALSVIKRAYKLGIVITAPFVGSPDDRHKIPNGVAKSICSKASDYPLILVEAAQSQLTKSAGAKAKAPGAVARSEGWF